jgi:hypothetical protein
MKPSSEQTRNGVLSAVSFRPESMKGGTPPLDPPMLKMKSLFRYDPTVSVEAAAEASVDPTNAYGCVDWFIYPDSQVREQK